MTPRRFTFYLGAPEPSWLNRNDQVPLCVTAARFDRIKSGRTAARTNRPWPITTVKDYIIDSGAYTALTQRTVSPWWDDPETYASKIVTFADNSGVPPEFCAPQDLPCEDDALAATGMTIEQHQKITVENFLYLTSEWSFPRLFPWIPVLQGWEPEDYERHEQMYLDAGVELADCRRVGIGSICTRAHLPEIVDVIERLAGRGYALHGFGLKITALPVVGHLLRSADSMAWSKAARHATEDTRTAECQHDGDCRNCYVFAKRWHQRVIDLMTLKEKPVPTTKPAPAADGGGAAAALKMQSTINWHRRGTVVIPRQLSGFDAGQIATAYVCCLCGDVEIGEYTWRINHGCCDSVNPWCKRKGRATGGFIDDWKPGRSELLAMGQLGGLDVGDVVALPGERQPIRIAAIDIPARAPHMAILRDRHGNSIEIDGRNVHTLDILARGRRNPHFPSNAKSVHPFIPLAENMLECAQCGGGNYPHHAEAPDGPGRFTPVVPPPGVQPVADPGTHEGFRDLVSKGVLIDMAGLPLTFVDCLCRRGKVSGMTCPIDVRCPQCGSKKGQKCMRPSEHTAADYHSTRVQAAEKDMADREAAGDPDVPAPWPGKQTKEAAPVAAATPGTTKTGTGGRDIRWNPYRGADAVLGSELKPGEQIRCPVSGCDRRAKIKRDGKVAAHKMYGTQSCHTVGLAIPADVAVDVLSRREANAHKAAAAQQGELDGMAALFGDLLSGSTVEKAVAAVATPDTTPVPRVYDAQLMDCRENPKQHPAGARVVRIDELAKLWDEDEARVRSYNSLPVAERTGLGPGWRSWCIASDGEGIPARHVFYLDQQDVPGKRSDDGTTMWKLRTLHDGDRGHHTGEYELWGSEKVTIIPPGTGGFGPGMFQLYEKTAVQTTPDGPWLRVTKITWDGVFVKGQKDIVAWSQIVQYRNYGNEIHPHASEVSMTHGTCDPLKNFGFDGGEHQFVPTFVGSQRCKVCLDSIRWKGHTGILNADWQGFEEIRQRLLRPANTWQARFSDAELLDRYVRGLPLVRYERTDDVFWNWVCPRGNLRTVDAPNCGGMHIGFRTLRAAKEGWLRHCAENHPDSSTHDSWGRWWRPTWDDEAFPPEPGIVFDPSKFEASDKPVAVKVVVPRTDPSWERLIEQFKTEGRMMATTEPNGRNRNGYVTVQFDEGQPAAAMFRRALHDAGVSYKDIEMVQPLNGTRGQLSRCLATTFETRMVQRSTGTVRDPEKMFAELDEAQIRQLLALPRAADGETAVIRGVIVHCGSGHAFAVGWFDGRRDADEWWQAGFNRFRQDKDVEFVVLAPNTWENDYDRQETGNKTRPVAKPKPEPKPEPEALPGLSLDDFMSAMGATPEPAAAPVDELGDMMAALAGIAAVAVPDLPVRPGSPSYITLPQGWTGPERAKLPEDTIVVLAKGKYHDSKITLKPSQDLHIANFTLPEVGLCQGPLVATQKLYSGFTAYAIPENLDGRDDARYGHAGDATCKSCRWWWEQYANREMLPLHILGPIKKSRRDERERKAAVRAAAAEPGPDATDGAKMLLTEVPLYSYIEVPGRDGKPTRRGYLIETPRVHTAGWGEGNTHRDEPYLKYLLGEAGTTVGMYSPMYLKVSVLESPEEAPNLPEPHETRPICVQDLRAGDVVDRGGLKQKTRDGLVTVIGRPLLVSTSEVRIPIRVAGQDTTARVDRWSWVQLTEVAAYAQGDELPLAAESRVPERDLYALREECKKIVGSYQGGVDSQELFLWAAGALRLRSGYLFWQSWHSGDQMASWLPASKAAHGAAGKWVEFDKGGFAVYPSSPKNAKDAKAMRQAGQVTEQGWDQVLPFMSRVPDELRTKIEDLMADREAANPGLGYTAEHINPAPRDAESTAERTYRMNIEHDLFKLAMEAWVAVRPS